MNITTLRKLASLAIILLLSLDISAQGTIASRQQVNTCVPTVYIDILDGYKENDKLVSTKDENKNNVYKFKNTSGEYVEISDAILADNPEIITQASSDRWTNYYKVKWNNPKQETYDLAVITIIDKSESIKPRHELTTIRGRGNSTWTSDKRAFRLKFPSKTKLLAQADGTNEYANAKSWTLIANAADKALIRNALATEIGKKVGLAFNVAYKFVDLIINGEYYGSYQIGDHIQVDSKRVNIDENEGWFMEFIKNEDAFKEDPYITPSAQYVIGYSYNTWSPLINIKNPEVTDDDANDPKIQAIKTWFENVIPTFSDNSDEKGWHNYIDIPTLVDYMITNELTGNYDGVISNYAYKDVTDEKLKFGPIWDNDLSFGNYTDATDKHVWEQNGTYQAFATFVSNIALADAVYIKAFWRKYKKVCGEDGSAMKTFINGKVTELTDAIRCSIEDNNVRWKLNEQLVGGISSKMYNTYSDAISTITNFVDTHTSWLANDYSARYNALKSASSYTLDASTTNASATPFSDYSNKITPTNVTNRTFTANKWEAICLPFDLDEDELKAVFGNDVQLAEYTLLSGTTLTFTPQESLSLHAGVPYLVKPSTTVTNPDFGDVVLSIQKPMTIKLSDDDEISFVGTFFKTTTVTDGTISIVNNGEVAANSADNVIGVSAYIVKPAGTEITINILGSEVSALGIDMTKKDNATTLTDKQGGTYDITLTNRGNLYADGWCTICLPFTMAKKDFETAIGFETSLRELGSINGTSFEFQKLASSPKTMVAGTPYLIMIDPATAPNGANETLDLGTITFSNVKLEAIEGTSVSPKDGYAFVGILQATDLLTDGTQLFLGGTGDKLYIPIESDKTLSGGKAYFTVPDKNSANNAKIDIDGVITTMIEALHNTAITPADNNVYNLNGQMVGKNIDALPKGIYIVNGKKIIK